MSSVAQPTERTKHWGMYAIWLREAVANGELVLEYVCTSEQSADCLTKALPAPAIACAEARMSGRSTEPAAHWTRRERSLCAMGDARAEHEWLELDAECRPSEA